MGIQFARQGMTMAHYGLRPLGSLARRDGNAWQWLKAGQSASNGSFRVPSARQRRGRFSFFGDGAGDDAARSSGDGGDGVPF